jgi:sugar diacid utilization regulator
MLEFQEVGIAAIGVYEYEDLFVEGCSRDLIALGNEMSIPIIKMQMPHTYEKIIQYFANRIFIDFYRKFMLKEEIQNRFYMLHKMGKLDRFAQVLWEVTQKDVVIRLKDFEFNFCKFDIDLILDNRELWIEEPLDTEHDYGMIKLSSYYLKLADREYLWVGDHCAFDKKVDWFVWLFYEDELDSNTIALFRYALSALKLEQEERYMQFQRNHQKSISALLISASNATKEKQKDYAKLVKQFKYGRVFSYLGTIDEEKYNTAYLRITEYLSSTLSTRHSYLLGNYNNEYFVLIVQVGDRALTARIAKAFLDICDDLMDPELPKVVGVGDLSEGNNLARSFANANRALFWARKVQHPFIIFEDLGMLRFFYSDDEYRWANEIRQRYIERLKEYDESSNGNLLETMIVLVKNLWSRNRTAQEMFVHSNTVRYRLKKIQTILGVDFQKRETREDLEVAISLEILLSKER